MTHCLLHNLDKGNETNIFSKCGDFDVYSEISGPRIAISHPELPNKVGFLLDDGSIDFDGTGKSLFLPQHFRIQELHESYSN